MATLDKFIDQLQKLRTLVGGDAEVVAQTRASCDGQDYEAVCISWDLNKATGKDCIVIERSR